MSNTANTNNEATLNFVIWYTWVRSRWGRNDKRNIGIHHEKQRLLASERASVVIVVKTRFCGVVVVRLAWAAEKPRFWFAPGSGPLVPHQVGDANIWNLIEDLCWFIHIGVVVVAVDQIGTAVADAAAHSQSTCTHHVLSTSIFRDFSVTPKQCLLYRRTAQPHALNSHPLGLRVLWGRPILWWPANWATTSLSVQISNLILVNRKFHVLV